jgi:hypothetical protein
VKFFLRLMRATLFMAVCCAALIYFGHPWLAYAWLLTSAALGAGLTITLTDAVNEIKRLSDECGLTKPTQER